MYDYDGLRVSKTVNGVVHNYIYASGKLLREVITTGDGNTAITQTLDFFYDANGTPLALKVGNATYYYVTNLQGDVIQLVDGTGAAVAVYEYDPYGNIVSQSGDLADLNPLRYRGYYYDKETGFYYLQSRYYDPKIGRFINADSYASTGQGVLGYNMFAYCRNNPVILNDEAGTYPRSGFSAIAKEAPGRTVWSRFKEFTGRRSELAKKMDAIVARIVGANSLEDIIGDNEILKNSAYLMKFLLGINKIDKGFSAIYLSQSNISTKIITAGFSLIGAPIPTPIEDIVGIALIIHGGVYLYLALVCYSNNGG